MKRYSGQKALYEAMSRSRRRRNRLGLFDRLRPQLDKVGKLAKSVASGPKLNIRTAESAVEQLAPPVLRPPRPVEQVEVPAKASPAQTWLRPKAIQFNAGRIEVSLPYQLGIVIGLLVIVAVLVVYRLGQIDQRARYSKTETVRSNAGIQPTGSAGAAETAGGQSATVSSNAAGGSAAGAVADGDDHVIVLARHQAKAHLEPVQEFFREHGIMTTILSFEKLRGYFASNPHLNADAVPKGDGFMLVSGRCANPTKPGTNGYAVMQKIVEIGGQYEAPKGRESFAKHRFSDAYGMKIK